jgi:hypothetical protein
VIKSKSGMVESSGMLRRYQKRSGAYTALC